MANFTVRVELHGVKHDSETYAELHDEMETEGFKRTITRDGATFHLPSAEYSKVCAETKQQILERAIAAAARVMGSKKKFSVLVTADENPRAFHNLDPKK
ncbi:hypothetical protein ACQUKI_20475 [Ralstonia pseudosolanacearum]